MPKGSSSTSRDMANSVGEKSLSNGESKHISTAELNETDDKVDVGKSGISRPTSADVVVLDGSPKPTKMEKITVTCTACQNVVKARKLYSHPKLKVLLCQACFYGYKHTKFVKTDGDNYDLCSWCGKEGELICCDYCSGAFHSKCIIHNVSKKYYEQIADYDKWACFICDSLPIKKAREACETYKDYLVDVHEKDVPKKGRKPFLSPTEKMPPKVALVRCLQNSYFSARDLKDAVVELQGRLNAITTPADIDLIGQGIKTSLLAANEKHLEIIKAIDCLLAKVRQPRGKPATMKVSTSVEDFKVFDGCESAAKEPFLPDGEVSASPITEQQQTCASESVTKDIITDLCPSLRNSVRGSRVRRNIFSDDNDDETVSRKDSKHENTSKRAARDVENLKSTVKTEIPDSTDVEMINGEVEVKEEEGEDEEAIATSVAGNVSDTDDKTTEMDYDQWESSDDKSETENNEKEVKSKKKISQRQKKQKLSDDECDTEGDEKVVVKPKTRVSKKFVKDDCIEDSSDCATDPLDETVRLENGDADLESTDGKNSGKSTGGSKKKRGKDADIQSGDSVDSEPEAKEEIKLKPRENKNQITCRDDSEEELKDDKKAKPKSAMTLRTRAESKLKSGSYEDQSSDDAEEELDMKNEKKAHLKSKRKPKTKIGKNLVPDSDDMQSSDEDVLPEVKDDVKVKSKGSEKQKAKVDKNLKPESDDMQSSDEDVLPEVKDDVKVKSKGNEKLKSKLTKNLKPESDEQNSSDEDVAPEVKDDIKVKSKGNEKQKAKVDKNLKRESDEHNSSEYETAPEMKQKDKKLKSKISGKLKTKANIKLKLDSEEVQSSEDDVAGEKKVESKSDGHESSSKDESESDKQVKHKRKGDTHKSKEKQKPKSDQKLKNKDINKPRLSSEEQVKTSDDEMQEVEEDLGKETNDGKSKTKIKKRQTAKDDQLDQIDKKKANEDMNEEQEAEKTEASDGEKKVQADMNVSVDVKADIEDEEDIFEPTTDVEANVRHHWQNLAEDLENEIEAVISGDDREKNLLRSRNKNISSGSATFELPQVGSATESDSEDVKPTTSKDSWKIESPVSPMEVKPPLESTPENEDDKPKPTPLRLSLKKVSPKDDEKSSKPDDLEASKRKNSKFRGLKFSSDSDTSDDSKNVKSVVTKIENDLLEDKKMEDGEEPAVDPVATSPVDDSDVEAKKELLKMLDDSDTDELAAPLEKRKKIPKRNKLSLPKPSPVESKAEDEVKVPKKSKVDSHLTKRNKLHRLLEESDDSLPSVESKQSRPNTARRTGQKLSSSAGASIVDYKTLMQDRKLKMKAQVVVTRMSNEELEFILENGYKAWKKRQKSNAGMNSSDEEFVRMCNLTTLRRKNKRPEKKVTDSSDDSDDCSKSKDKAKKSKGKGIKPNKDDLHLSAINTSDSSRSDQSEEEHSERSKKKTVVSSDSEPVFKSANDLAKERLLKDLASSDDEDEDKSSDEDDDSIKSLDDDSAKSDSRKKKKKRKAVSGSGEESKSTKKRDSDDDDDDDDFIKKKEAKRKKRKVGSGSDTNDSKPAKKYDSEDDFVPVNKGRRLRSNKAAKSLNSDSDSNDSIKATKRKRTRGKDSDTGKVSTSSATSIGSRKRKRGKDGKAGGKKRRRRIKMASSSDSSVEEVSGSDDLQTTPSGKGRKNIRKLISDRKLTTDTKMATREEDERRKRVADLQKLYNEVYDKEGKSGTRVTTKLVLATDTTSNETLEINEAVICKLKPHQVEGVKFMWECTGESLERLDSTPGSGCILAHCMGLGKTLQVIAFLHTILTREKENPKTALVVCPVNTILNWHRECETWLEDVYPSILILEMSRVKHYRDRLMVLKNWNKHGGILILGYDNFRMMVQENSKRIPKFYRELFQTLLVNPGPDVVVCDEGHILKNLNTGISKAMSRINTKRRIILTGTPLQNNLTEYHCMVNFVKPNLLGTLKEFQNRFINPIHNGQHTDSTPIDVRIMKSRAHILHNLLDGCVQRRDYNVLTPFLPPKYEYILSVRLSEIQIKLYSYYLNNLCSRLHGKGHLFGDYQCLMRIWTHPRVIRLAEIRQENKANNESHDSFIDDNSESSSSESKTSVILEDSDEPGTSKKSNHDSDTEVVVNNWKTRSRSQAIPENEVQVLNKNELIDEPLNTWWTTIISEDEAKKIEHSGKMMVLFDILRQCEEIGDKLLLFSQSLLSLDYIESIITGEESVEGAELHPFVGKMVRGVDYFRLDGSTSADSRSKFIRSFNDKDSLKARLFLISTKAGSLGINLVAANRVVIFDASWNPTHDIQSIFRVYRFGQTKPVYIYRLVAHGTMEEKIYDRQVTKQSLACRVIDEQQIERHFSFADLQELYSFDPDNVRNRATPIVPKDKLLAELLIKRKDLITSYHEHDSLLVNQAEEELTEEERRAAWVEYECERRALSIEVGMKVDVHATIQNIQRQNPGISIPDLTAKVDEIFKALAIEMREKRIQQQKLLLQQQQQRLQQQMQFAPQLNYAYQNQAQDMGLFGQRHMAQLDINRQFPGLGQMAMAQHPAFAKVNSLPPDKPFK